MTTIDLSPATLDLKGIRAGDRNLISVTLTSDGAPLNLTGQTVTAQARKKATDADPPALTATINVTSATAGKLTMQWPGDAVRTVLADQATWTGVWDLQIKDATNPPTTVVAGSFEAVMDVTR